MYRLAQVVYSVFLLALMPASAASVFVAHGGGSAGAAHGGEIGIIDLDTFAYTTLTPSLGSLTSLIHDGTSLFTYNTITSEFIEIDPTTGAVVSAVSRIGGSAPTDMAYDPVTGTAYAIDTGFELHTVNLSTGEMTFVGTVNSAAGGFSQLAFSPTGVLYAHATNAPGEFWILDPATGQTTSTIPGGVPGGALGLGYDPVSGNLLASECCSGSDGSLGERLFWIDPTTGTATLLFDYDDGRRIQDFAFAPSAVPEPGSMWLLAAGVGALFSMRKRV